MPKQSIQTQRASRTPRKVTYRPPNVVHLPEEIVDHFARQGKLLRWIRITIDGKDDYKNIARKRKENYTFVTRSDIPEHLFELLAVEIPEEGRWNNVLTVGDVALGMIPIEYAKARNDYYAEKTRKQSEAIRHMLGKESRRGTHHMAIEDESQTVISKGRRPAGFGQTTEDSD